MFTCEHPLRKFCCQIKIYSKQAMHKFSSWVPLVLLLPLLAPPNYSSLLSTTPAMQCTWNHGFLSGVVDTGEKLVLEGTFIFKWRKPIADIMNQKYFLTWRWLIKSQKLAKHCHQWFLRLKRFNQKNRMAKISWHCSFKTKPLWASFTQLHEVTKNVFCV